MFVLVIGRIEFIMVTPNHDNGISPSRYRIAKMIVITIGVIMTVSRNMCLTHVQ